MADTDSIFVPTISGTFYRAIDPSFREFAIRRFLAADLDRALAKILPWTGSGDEHVRRLASEGTRPFLPWAVRVAALTSSPEKTVPILDALRTDPSEYVRRSVANHLNDLSRHNPGLVVQTAARWLERPDTNTAWVVRHGLRTLVKRADPGALALMGFSDATVRVSPITVADETIVLDVYGAREDPVPGVTGALVSERFADASKVAYLPDWQEASDFAASIAREGDIIMTLSCGDVYRIVPQLLASLEASKG